MLEQLAGLQLGGGAGTDMEEAMRDMEDAMRGQLELLLGEKARLNEENKESEGGEPGDEPTL